MLYFLLVVLSRVVLLLSGLAFMVLLVSGAPPALLTAPGLAAVGICCSIGLVGLFEFFSVDRLARMFTPGPNSREAAFIDLAGSALDVVGRIGALLLLGMMLGLSLHLEEPRVAAGWAFALALSLGTSGPVLARSCSSNQAQMDRLFPAGRS